MAAQVFGLEPVQLPETHASVWVQALPSLHIVPSLFAGFEHTPLVGLHVPALWHWSLAAHVTGFAPRQAPEMQASL